MFTFVEWHCSSEVHVFRPVNFTRVNIPQLTLDVAREVSVSSHFWGLLCMYYIVNKVVEKCKELNCDYIIILAVTFIIVLVTQTRAVPILFRLDQ